MRKRREKRVSREMRDSPENEMEAIEQRLAVVVVVEVGAWSLKTVGW